MVRYMADAIDPGQFPGSIAVPGAGVQPVSLRAGYINGRWPTALQAGTEVSIDVNGGAPQADVLDIETGDATPEAAPDWVRAHYGHSGERAVLYCNRSVRPAVANACAASGLQAGRDFWWWIATLDGTTAVPDMTGVIAVQVWGANYFPGWNIDLSIVYDDSWKGTDDMFNDDDRQAIDEIRRMIGVLTGWGRAANDHEQAAADIPLNTQEARRMIGVLLGWAPPASDNEQAALAKLWGTDPQQVKVTVDPASIAAAIPHDIAQQVLDELAKRVAPPAPAAS